jgi:predicted DNA-binding transcriptional regulator AlpA
MEMLLREDETMRELKVSRTSLWRLRRDGRLRAVHIGRSLRYPAEEVRRLVDELLAEETVAAVRTERVSAA